MEARSECSHEDADDDRATCDAELDRSTDAWDHDRDATKYKSEDDTDEQRKQVRILKLLRLVSKDYAHVLHGTCLTHDGKFVSKLKTELTRWKKVDSGTVHTSDVDTI